jgi:hypothetical protein
MSVILPMVEFVPVRAEIVENLASTFGNRSFDQLNDAKAAIEVGAPDMCAQLLRFGESLRPLGIVQKNFSPWRREKNRGCVGVRGRSPVIGRAMPFAAQVADQIGQPAIKKTCPALRAVRDLRAHSFAAFLRERRKIIPWKEAASLRQLLAYQHSGGFLVADLARFRQRIDERALAGTRAAGDHDSPQRHSVNYGLARLGQMHR